jgi:hypothetical protein
MSMPPGPNRDRYTDQPRLWIVIAASLVGVIIASALFVASDRTAWPLLAIAPACGGLASWLTNR